MQRVLCCVKVTAPEIFHPSQLINTPLEGRQVDKVLVQRARAILSPSAVVSLLLNLNFSPQILHCSSHSPLIACVAF